MALRGVFAAAALMHLADATEGYCLEIRNCCNENDDFPNPCEGFEGTCNPTEVNFFYKDNKPGLLPQECDFMPPTSGCENGEGGIGTPSDEMDGCARWYCSGVEELVLTLTANSNPAGNGFIAGKSELKSELDGNEVVAINPNGVCGENEEVALKTRDNVNFTMPSLAVYASPPATCRNTENEVDTAAQCLFNTNIQPGLVSSNLQNSRGPIIVDAKYYDDNEEYVMYARITVAPGDRRNCNIDLGWS